MSKEDLIYLAEVILRNVETIDDKLIKNELVEGFEELEAIKVDAKIIIDLLKGSPDV